MVTRFKSYPPTSTSSVHYSSGNVASYSMASSPLKNVSSTKGKCYKNILLRRPFKKIRYSDATDDSNIHILLASPIQNAHAGTSFGHAPSIIVKTEVPDVSPPRATLPYTSSSISGSRVAIETVILDSNSASSNGDDSVILSKLLHRFKIGDIGPSSISANCLGYTFPVPCCFSTSGCSFSSCRSW
ncbi:flocculation protein FLO11-like [Cucumis melo var. makuwa]|uniref:Flocculation protein FLO11-like n=1 Tax=Cucumis melo var. makuwa TaxID=1194695 RepID=A0A5D3DVS7_CUCMM|nr:flocculation protein FLO11-like [Cucumis melo var. makuwa]TYK27604.1 flocculation protein FLO11-like [Cucumis melo var. makuwa]